MPFSLSFITVIKIILLLNIFNNSCNALSATDAHRDEGVLAAGPLQFVQSGAAEIGIVALSLAVSPAVASQGKYWEVPLNAYPKMEQGGAIMKWTKDAASAQALRSFILGKQGRALLKRYGFFPPGE